MDEEKYIICTHCNGIIRKGSKECIYCNGMVYFDSFDILDILRSRIYNEFRRLYFHDKRIELDGESYWSFTKLVIYLSLFSSFLFVLCNFTDNGLYIINRILGEKIEVSSVLKFIPFGFFYIILCFFVFSKMRLDFRGKGIDADTTKGFITYQRSDEFKKDFPSDPMCEDFSFYFDRLHNRRVRRSIIDFIVNGTLSAVEEKVKVISEIDEYLLDDIERINDWKNEISYSFLSVFFSAIGNIAIFFVWYMIVSLPFIFIFKKIDPFFIDISFLDDVKLFIQGSSPDVIKVFISPLATGIIFGCLCGFVKSLNELSFFLQKKGRLEYLYDIREQIVDIKERLNNRLLHDI
ncbi:MAG: hypothetical protein SD837_00465 [Candidatus Electrothrix scaldis]|nr:MAG: hypothetical protein SD837_00465 [Candidatus Electrothrix sp. GW3-3]